MLFIYTPRAKCGNLFSPLFSGGFSHLSHFGCAQTFRVTNGNSAAYASTGLNTPAQTKAGYNQKLARRFLLHEPVHLLGAGFY